jgi:CheY-like chemotaxis protein
VELEGDERTILLVESSVNMQDAIRNALKKRGYRVLVFGNPHRALQRFQDYAQDAYYSEYAIRRIVGRLQRAITEGFLLACLQKRLNPLQLLRCYHTRLLLLFGVLYLLIQASIIHYWIPQETSRLADGVAFFLLISFIAWFHHYRAYWCVIPALYVTLQYWLERRILPSAQLSCGLNDDFLCIPDRWPWQVHY